MPKTAGQSVPPVVAAFLSRKPVIDGLPKPETEALRKIDLAFLPDGSPPQSPPPPASLRVAYGAEFLYLQAEFAADRLIARDRGYQFGDGLVVVVAEPRPDDTPSDRYFLLGFSHQEKPAFQWASRVLWEHDRKTELAMLDRSVEVAAAVVSGTARLEVCIPWARLHPYHPWLSESIGLNASLVKARGDVDTDFYALLPDEGGEQASRRSVRIQFGNPTLASGEQIAVMASGRIQQGEKLRARIALLAADVAEVHLAARLRTAEGDPVSADSLAIRGNPGLTHLDWDVATDALPADGYRIEWRAPRAGLEWDQGLSVLPNVDRNGLVGRVAALTRMLPEPDAATLLFEANDVCNQLASLAPTRTAGAQRLGLDRLLRDCREMEEGRNPVAKRRGVFRRAFRSRIDATLQPFSVLIPDDVGSRTECPLCVTFHGSGVDDVHYMSRGKNEFPRHVLVAAPFGRGASNWFTQGAAQEDVAEAVASMCEAYAVRRDRIYLFGFSMGAYGALRTYYENPARYRAVAVFCTPPAARINGETHPDFARPEFASAFAGTPVFAFHGRKDNSTPFVDAERMVAALREAGAHVTFCVEDEAGHGLPGAETTRAYLDWVDRVIRA